MLSCYHLEMTRVLSAINTLSPRLLDLIDASVAAQLRAVSNTIRYDDGQLIHSRGDPKPGVSIVREGAVHIGSVGKDGSFISTSVFGPGQCFGEHTVFSGLPRTHDVFAIGEARVDQISGPDFMAVFEREPSLGRALLIVSQIRTHILVEQLDDLRRLPLPIRAAKYLVDNVDRAGADDGTHDVRIRQSDMVFAMGVSRVSIGKVLNKLQDENLIVLGYGAIRLPDLARLERWISGRTKVSALRPNLG